MSSIIWFLLIGLIAGWGAGLIMKGRGFGMVGDMIVGILGAVIGGFMFGLLGIGTSTFIGDLIMATIGAVSLLFIVSLIRRSNHQQSIET